MMHASRAVDIPGVALNPNARVEIKKIGHEQQPVFIVDQALINVEAMVAFAAEHTTFGPPPSTSRYPGRVAPLPASYMPNILAALRRPLESVFGYVAGPRPTSFGFYGLATVLTADLMPDQVIPHADATQPNAYASVHFLSAHDYGGTAFYRHKATGLEVVSPAKSQASYQQRNAELEAYKGSPHSKLQALYEEIAYIEPVANRLILYRAGQLHSAKMAGVDTLPDDPRTGRLTANLFVNIG
ncbi:DUF6445 family protein [Asticcacaulis sp. SL142]|uniref:DUF6445 family protein n=1 Tax=Asticcacaulis sp. SL142 TaxID=2995155 RepID=UPI00226CAFC4|nr:DUF6445 family protein [Asticcacaulis sp. SL142]WAC46841.1 DUF6445 family protein [Asticcacaulis sp. SL142]